MNTLFLTLSIIPFNGSISLKVNIKSVLNRESFLEIICLLGPLCSCCQELLSTVKSTKRI